MSSRSGPFQVGVVSEVRLYREGLAAILADRKGLEVVAVSAGLPEDLSRLLLLEPDVILMDMATAGAYEIVREIVHSSATGRVVALGVSEAESEVVACAEAGVSGYVFRDGSADDLSAAVRSAARGELRCSRRVAATLLHRVAVLAGRTDPGEVGPRLTRREVEIVRLVDEGMTNKEIAHRLSIEVTTVKNHIHHVLEKMAVSTRGQAAMKARRLGLISPFRPVAQASLGQPAH